MNVPEVRDHTMAPPSGEPAILQSNKDAQIAKQRSRSQTTISNFITPSTNSLPANTSNRSVRRKSQDIRLSSGSIFLRPEKPESLAKTLMTRGSKLLRRQNSRTESTSLRTWQWLETSQDNMDTNDGHSAKTLGDLRHNRIHSTGSE